MVGYCIAAIYDYNNNRVYKINSLMRFYDEDLTGLNALFDQRLSTFLRPNIAYNLYTLYRYRKFYLIENPNIFIDTTICTIIFTYNDPIVRMFILNVLIMNITIDINNSSNFSLQSGVPTID